MPLFFRRSSSDRERSSGVASAATRQVLASGSQQQPSFEELCDQQSIYQDDTVTPVDSSCASDISTRVRSGGIEKSQQKSHHGGSRSALLDVVRNFRIGMDLLQLRSLQLPAWIYKPVSLCEEYINFSCPIDEMDHLGSATPEERLLIMLKASLRVMGRVPQESFFGSKPYNPILGEEFHCIYESERSVTECHAEQVSHHPAITALFLRNEQAGWYATSVLQPTVRLSGPNSIEFRTLGDYALCYKVGKGMPDEVYRAERPNFVGKGLLWGSSRIELGGIYRINCEQTGWSSFIEIEKDGILNGFISYFGQEVMRIEGNMGAETPMHERRVFVRDLRRSGAAGAEPRLLLRLDDVSISTCKKRVRPLQFQLENESRRVWHRVTYALQTQPAPDYEAALLHKTQIEEKQRQIAREAGGDPEAIGIFKPKYFRRIGGDASAAEDLAQVPQFEFIGGEAARAQLPIKQQQIGDCIDAESLS